MIYSQNENNFFNIYFYNLLFYAKFYIYLFIYTIYSLLKHKKNNYIKKINTIKQENALNISKKKKCFKTQNGKNKNGKKRVSLEVAFFTRFFGSFRVQIPNGKSPFLQTIYYTNSISCRLNVR